MEILLIVALTGSFLVLFLSIYPGVLSDLAFLAMVTSCLWLPIVGFVAVVFLIRQTAGTGKGKEDKLVEEPSDDFAGIAEPHASHRRRVAIALTVLVVNISLFAFGVPRRIAFAVSRPAFEPFLAPVLTQQGVELHRRLGLYQVDRVAADSRGGVYFRTHTGRDGIGPDTMSYGFAYRPNPTGSPFGRAGYDRFHLFGQWYSFEASNDYH